ncbi:MAG: EAL domain-containing protein [Deltaproteobacteria bacterium]|nr:EAL domain-containing protein [Deltaproteobacteria bacterium]MCW5800856.1 EAL domain-containing protein [Deltaproteobacteria bacterium]
MAVTKSHLGRVLVVDDDPAMRKACARLLATEGWNVVVAENGRAAIDAMDGGREQFDCVVSDVHMPELDGFGLIAAIRRHDDELPVLLMTADPSLDGAVRAIDNGAVSYLSKPFDQGALGTAVARAARRHGVARMRRRAESSSPLFGDDMIPRFERALARAWMAFQPIVDVTARRVFAYEALIRTDEPSLQRPDVLITVAEKLGRVHDLGRTVRAAVARAMPTFPTGVLAFVNLHGLELDDEQLFDPRSELAAHSSRVVLEITERIGLDPAIGASRVAMLRRMGYRIAVDDLGAGYSALGALASLEPEVVKLDMSLVRDLQASPTKRRVVGAIATLVRELGGRVVAEGVEQKLERDAVLACGIELLQGYLFARPSRELEVVERDRI